MWKYAVPNYTELFRGKKSKAKENQQTKTQNKQKIEIQSLLRYNIDINQLCLANISFNYISYILAIKKENNVLYFSNLFPSY